MPKQHVEPYIWGFIGTAIVAAVLFICYLTNTPFLVAQPLAGGFFTGWLAGNLWNWAGKRR